jgi:hypothetical protein
LGFLLLTMPTLFSCLVRTGGVAPEAEGAHRFSGLRNPTGTTCHLNAVLQALFMTPEFRSELLQCHAGELPSTAKAVVSLFQQLALGGRTLSTKQVSNALKPVHICTRQQDCHDTWLVLCDQLEASLKLTPQAKLVSELFEGKQLNYVRCHECSTVSDTKDTFYDLSIAVPDGDVADGESSDEEGDDDGDDGDDEAGAEAGAQPDSAAAKAASDSDGIELVAKAGASSIAGAAADGGEAGDAMAAKRYTAMQGLHEVASLHAPPTHRTLRACPPPIPRPRGGAPSAAPPPSAAARCQHRACGPWLARVRPAIWLAGGAFSSSSRSSLQGPTSTTATSASARRMPSVACASRPSPRSSPCT